MPTTAERRTDLHRVIAAPWVLEGRAVQDVWIVPSGADRSPESDKAMNTFGTTLRSRALEAEFLARRAKWPESGS